MPGQALSTAPKAAVAHMSLTHWVAQLDEAGLLYRHEGEVRVDELPQIMEDHPDLAVFVEQVRDCAFPFLANAFVAAEMCAVALGCDRRKAGIEIGERAARQRARSIGLLAVPSGRRWDAGRPDGPEYRKADRRPAQIVSLSKEAGNVR